MRRPHPRHRRVRTKSGISIGGPLVVSVLGASLLAVAPAAASSSARVTGLWHLDETSGSVAVDASGLGNDGVNHGALIGQPGHDGSAYSFVPLGSWVEVRSSDNLNPGTRDFSFSVWLNVSKAPANGQTYDPIRKGLVTTKTGDFKLEMFNGGKLRCIAKDANRLAASIYGPANNFADGQWHHVTCARNGSNWSITVDASTRSKVVPFGSIGNNDSLSVGSKYGVEDDVIGRVDEVTFTIG